MRIPLSWLKSHVDLPESLTPQEIAASLVSLGVEVDELRALDDVTGPLVIGRVVRIEELTEFKKPIRYCQVDVGDNDEEDDDGNVVPPETRGIICGATNFDEGDLVVVALPGAVLPGGFEITARKTYGRTSNGMICSVRELGLGEDHTGILVLPSGEASPGDDAGPLLGLDDTVLDLEITTDRGYAMSIRGLARELACKYGTTLMDPAALSVPGAEGDAHGVHIEDQLGCPRFVARRVTGLDPTSPTPWFMRRRLMLAGIRSISLAVDVTNYVMLETGQPMHSFDTSSIKGNLVVRKANPGEKLSTLDDAERSLDPDDIVICDDTGPISLAGVMGGASTEVRPDSTDILLEAAVWDPRSISRTVRRHKLPSEASKRFERSVDPALPPFAAERAAQLLREHGEARIQPGRTDVGRPELPGSVIMAIDLPDRVAGINYARGVTAHRLSQIGCHVEVTTTDAGRPAVLVVPPTWRPDLTRPADLVEEVLRLEGYDTIPSVLPTAPAGRGLTPVQRRRRAVSRTLADAGYVEVTPSPFVSSAAWDAFGLDAEDIRRRTMKVLNPLDAERAELTTTLLPGLLEMLARNVSRGARDVSLFYIGQVFLPRAEPVPMPTVSVDHRPTDDEIAALNAGLPQQPVHVAVVLAGNRERAGWWGKGEPATWADAVQAARDVAAAAGVDLTVQAGDLLPWHPGRCAELRVGGWPVGHAGELHPKVVEALGLPRRTCAMELDLDALPIVRRRPAPAVSPYPPVLLDVALVVDVSVPVAEVAATLRSGGGDLLEDVQLFDVYTGEQIGEGKRSLAYSLRFRAADRTLTVEEATTAKEAAVAVLADRFGATLR
ncbi:phenylalanine--tRNA ligase subunit beta [Actinocrispum wychmicini]|uniref:Phenylalanine--tRNA ligase beta subunit n=1 Tax=Actinocrispum wychmicini TaxID=1213861 RepID=A0A4R2J9B2_9PSEU|nr:phenylalanine--tRNA ligase subunit beta [Actinocrispum wychmicini]TCO53188.1 phenylalanyl-tRNA synthetase beta subunit [Actinocrispum wychmicini]